MWSPAEVRWDRHIEVPFSPETPASGIGDTRLFKAVWYRLKFRPPELGPKERLLLHFGAVDNHAMVWVDGTIVVEHEGGYTPFSADITDALGTSDEHEIVVRAYDHPGDLDKPRGKQDWQADPHSIWYPRTTGIWQTVWLERVPKTQIRHLQWNASIERWEIGLDAFVLAEERRKLTLSVKLHADELVLAEDRYTVVAGEVRRGIALSDPGIDDFRNELLWSTLDSDGPVGRRSPLGRLRPPPPRGEPRRAGARSGGADSLPCRSGVAVGAPHRRVGFVSRSSPETGPRRPPSDRRRSGD